MQNRKGFTLIELLIVVVIIGILAAIAIPKFASTKEKAYLASMKSDLRNLATAQEALRRGQQPELLLGRCDQPGRPAHWLRGYGLLDRPVVRRDPDGHGFCGHRLERHGDPHRRGWQDLRDLHRRRGGGCAGHGRGRAEVRLSRTSS